MCGCRSVRAALSINLGVHVLRQVMTQGSSGFSHHLHYWGWLAYPGGEPGVALAQPGAGTVWQVLLRVKYLILLATSGGMVDTLRPFLCVSGPNPQSRTPHTPLTELTFLRWKSYFQPCYNVHVVDFFFFLLPVMALLSPLCNLREHTSSMSKK